MNLAFEYKNNFRGIEFTLYLPNYQFSKDQKPFVHDDSSRFFHELILVDYDFNINVVLWDMISFCDSRNKLLDEKILKEDINNIDSYDILEMEILYNQKLSPNKLLGARQLIYKNEIAFAEVVNINLIGCWGWFTKKISNDIFIDISISDTTSNNIKNIENLGFDIICNMII